MVKLNACTFRSFFLAHDVQQREADAKVYYLRFQRIHDLFWEWSLLVLSFLSSLLLLLHS